MEKNDLQEIAALVNSAQSNKTMDMVFKFISTVSLALVGWVLTSVNAMQKDMVQLSADAQYMRSAIVKMEDFTSKPRFTQEHFDSQSVPLVKALNLLTDAVEDIENRLNKMDLERQKIQLDISVLQSQKK